MKKHEHAVILHKNTHRGKSTVCTVLFTPTKLVFSDGQRTRVKVTKTFRYDGHKKQVRAQKPSVISYQWADSL